jgi:hypothetical protein
MNWTKVLDKTGFTPWAGVIVNAVMVLLTYLSWTGVPCGSVAHLGIEWLAFVFMSAVCGIIVLSLAIADCIMRRWWGLLALPLALTPYWLCMTISSYMIAARAIRSDM